MRCREGGYDRRLLLGWSCIPPRGGGMHDEPKRASA